MRFNLKLITPYNEVIRLHDTMLKDETCAHHIDVDEKVEDVSDKLILLGIVNDYVQFI